MKKDIQFKTKVESAKWDEQKNVWKTSLDDGKSYTSRFFISASGVLSVGRNLPFEGVDKFKGEVCWSALVYRWYIC